MLTKLLRTIIGLPFVLIGWFFMVITTSLLTPIFLLWYFIMEGYFDITTIEVTIDWILYPYKFIKKVWK